MDILAILGEDAGAGQALEILVKARFRVETVRSPRDGLRQALSRPFTLVLLDQDLRDSGGIEVLQALRERRNSTPILILTSRRTAVDCVKALEAGADDCLTKPFDPRELLARVRALLRRDKVRKERLIRIADLEVDTLQHRVRRAGVEIHLTPREYLLLEALALNEGRVLSRETILESVWMDHESLSNTVTVHVGNLRRKVDAGHRLQLIQTVAGFGYSLRVEESLEERAA